jgi:3-phosphoshikimate 1-carboxyvinyltransferase
MDDLLAKRTTVVVRPARSIAGVVRIPGDKSISHRYAMLAAIAEGTSRFHNFSAALDCASTLDCVAKLGCEWKRVNGDAAIADGVLEVNGIGPQLSPPNQPLDCGNSGSTMRMLSGILAGQSFLSELCGDDSLSRRPMARIMTPLAQMGAKISSQDGGRPPLKIQGGPLKAIHYKPEVASAQVKSCVLFAGLMADGETVIEEPIRTRDHGEIALRAFGAEVERTRRSFKRSIFSLRGSTLPRLAHYAARNSYESHAGSPARHIDPDGPQSFSRASRGKSRRVSQLS